MFINASKRFINKWTPKRTITCMSSTLCRNICKSYISFIHIFDILRNKFLQQNDFILLTAFFLHLEVFLYYCLFQHNFNMLTHIVNSTVFSNFRCTHKAFFEVHLKKSWTQEHTLDTHWNELSLFFCFLNILSLHTKLLLLLDICKSRTLKSLAGLQFTSMT